MASNKKPQQPSPQEQPGKSLHEQVTDLLLQLNDCVGRIDQTVSQIEAADREVARRQHAEEANLATYNRELQAANIEAAEAAKAEVKKCRQWIAEAVAAVDGYAMPLKDLRAQHGCVRAEMLRLVPLTEAAIREAQADQRAVSRVDSILSHAGAKLDKLDEILATYAEAGEESGEAEPPAAVVENPSAPEKPTKPECPYCRSNRDVVAVSPGRWTCNRAHHGRITLNAAGRVVN